MNKLQVDDTLVEIPNEHAYRTANKTIYNYL